MSNLIPLSNNVIVLPIEKETTTSSGIIIPSTVSKEKPQRGKVIAVGPGKIIDGKKEKLEIKKNDVVIFSQYSPTEITVDGEMQYIVNSDSILAVESL